MRYVFVVLTVAAVIFSYFQTSVNKKQTTTVSTGVTPSTAEITVPETSATSAIFVPYWADFDELRISSYDRAVYFGISPTRTGYNAGESGYANLAKFVRAVSPDKKTYLTVRMVNQESALAIVRDRTSWEAVVNATLDAADEHNFDGIVLDLEVGALPFNDVTRDITAFIQNFAKQAKSENLKFAMTLYGDFNYRKRPYDIFVLSKHVDEIMVMAYDFHKSRGEPGPNFPLEGREKYGYDMVRLANDLAFVPREKLTFIFGMYGYDWMVDETKKPIRPAKALSLNDIKKEFINECEWKNCTVIRDPLSGETEVNYIDAGAYYHIVWFEDEQSVEKKIRFLKERGINSFAYWTYGYF